MAGEIGGYEQLTRKHLMSQVSLAKIAAEAGVSKAAASYALRGLPGVSAETRERILRVAEEQGYSVPARLRDTMSKIRRKEDLSGVIAMVSTDRGVFKLFPDLLRRLEGAQDQARRLGYLVDELYPTLEELDGLNQVLRSRGVDGILLFAPMSGRYRTIDSGLSNEFARVAIGPARIDTFEVPIVQPDLFLAGRMTVVQAAWRGYRRVGLQAPNTTFDPEERFLAGAMQAATHCKRVSLLIRQDALGMNAEICHWIQRENIECLISTRSEPVVIFKQAGLRVPDDVGLIHWRIEPTHPDVAAVNLMDHLVGAEAVNMLHEKILEKRQNVERPPCEVAMCPRWQEGTSLKPWRPVLSPNHVDDPFPEIGQIRPLDLRPHGTRSLAEHRGWFHDCRTPLIRAMTYRLHGVETRIFPETQDLPRGVILLQGQEQERRRNGGKRRAGSQPLPASVDLPVEDFCERVFLLLTSVYGAKFGRLGRVRLIFNAGEPQETELVAPEQDAEQDAGSPRFTIGDWWPTYLQPHNEHCKPVPVTGVEDLFLDGAFFSLLRIENRTPRRKVRGIRVEVTAPAPAGVALFAVSVGLAPSPQNKKSRSRKKIPGPAEDQ